MHVLCPQCRHPIEVTRIAANEEVHCPSCGGMLRLEGGATTGYEGGGERLGKFELMDTLGQGGFGTVYKARDPELDRVVALKVPRAGQMAGPKEINRFLREARSAAQLRHPAIVPIHEVGTLDGMPYLVSEYVEGVTLADLLSAKRPGFRESAGLVATVADALHYAHDRGVVHRDVKPSNIMVGPGGAPYVMDFGLAKRDGGEITMTVEGQVLGTPAYMPPEQARGEGHKVDARADVYSLGVVLYELLAGELPFRGNKRMLLHQVLHDDPRPPRGLNDAVPRDLETVCLKAMAKEPAKRYQTARELAEDLHRWLAGKGILARPAGRAERAVRWVRRHPARAGLVGVSGVAALALVALAVAGLYTARLEGANAREKEQKEAAEAARAEAVEARGAEEVQRRRAEGALALAERSGYHRSVSLAEVALKENDVVLARQRLGECKAPQRGWEWRFLEGQCQLELFSAPGDGAAFSPDGARLAVVGRDQPVRVYDAGTGREVLQIQAGRGRPQAAFSADGGRVVVWGDGTVRVCDARTGREVMQMKGGAPVVAVALSADGSRLAAGALDGALRVHDLRAGREVMTTRAPFLEGLALSADGARLAAVSQGTVQVLDVGRGVEVGRMLVPFGAAGAPAFSPDGAYLAVRDQTRAVRLYVVETGQEGRQLMGPPAEGFQFSPDGTLLAVSGVEKMVRLHDPRSGSLMRPLQSPDGVTEAVFSPDGSRVAAKGGDGVVRIFNAQNGLEVGHVKGPQGLSAPVFSPDGAFLAARGGDGRVRVYDARLGRESESLSVPRGLTGLAFSLEGRRLAARTAAGVVHVIDPWTGRGLSRFRPGGQSPRAVFSRDGSRVAAWGNDGVLGVYEAATGRALARLKAMKGLEAVEMSPDGSRVAVGAGDGAVRLYDATSGEAVPGFEAPKGRGAAFSADGARLAAWGADGSVRVCDARTGRELARLKGAVPLGGATFSSDGQRLAAASAPPPGGDGVVRVYEVGTGKEVSQLKGPAALGVAGLSPDGARLAVCGADGTLRVYEADTGLELLHVRAPGAMGVAPAFSADGGRLAVWWGNVVRIFDAPRDVAAWQAARRQAVRAGLPQWYRDQGERWEQAYADAKNRREGVAEEQFAENLAAFYWGRLAREESARGEDLYRHGWALARRGRRAEAGKAFEAALARKDLTGYVRGQAHAMLGQYREAAPLFAEEVKQPNRAVHVWSSHALLRLEQGDGEGYQKACAGLLERFGKRTSLSAEANAAAWAHALGPKARPDLAPALALARRCVQFGPRVWYHRGTLGALLCRAGKHAEAVAELGQAVKLHPSKGSPFSFVFLALAHHGLGEAEKARAALRQAKDAEAKAGLVSWQERLQLQLLTREAEGVVNGAGKEGE